MEQALIGALNYVSRNLPLPPQLFNTVSSICYGSEPKPLPCDSSVCTTPEFSDFFLYYSRFSRAFLIILFVLQDDVSNSTQDEDLLTELQDALSKQRPNCDSSSKLNKAIKIRSLTRIQHRLTQLEG